jgi:glycosyltransferase involved in cell wall biosynthesis
MEDRKKILVLSDHPLVPSGVGIQTKYLIEGLLETGRYKFVCLGGAIKHPSMEPQQVAPDKFGEGNWIIHPVNGHGDKNILRAFLMREKPDAILLVTDPRFFVWVWEMEDEIRSMCPITYWHVWDNDPTPDFNNIFYNSTDSIGCISLKTYGLLQGLDYKHFKYIPHALPDELFKPLPLDEVKEFKEKSYGPHKDKKFIVMWNNRNARRKQTGDVVATFAKFAEKVGKDNVALFLHTQVGDPEGQNVLALAKKFNIEKNLIVSEERVQPEQLNKYYNVADVVINIASNEGFGLGTLEALYTGTPIIVHMTGGLQYQIGDWYKDIKDFSNQDKLTEGAKNALKRDQARFFGVPVFSASRSCTGSQQIPYIFDDRVCHEDVVKALVKLYNMKQEDRKALGAEAREWAKETFNLKNMVNSWDELFQETFERFTPVGIRRATL